MDEYYAKVNEVELYHDLVNAGFMSTATTHPSLDLFSISEIAATEERDDQNTTTAVFYAI